MPFLVFYTYRFMKALTLVDVALTQCYQSKLCKFHTDYDSF
jgi:hypothetical protein